jgi:SAM-dependent methyltransferase
MHQSTSPAVRFTERQLRERQYYDRFSELAVPRVSFRPVKGVERRPWNPYWFVCELLQCRFVSPAQRLLDAGCGAGSYAVLFAHIGYEVFGFDISPNNVRIAGQLAQKHGFGDRIRIQEGVAERLEYPSDFFDAVVGIDILHHVDIERAVGECLRVLKPGGVAIFKEPMAVPVFDPLRDSRLGCWLAPKQASFERHLTEDERKLTAGDLATIRRLSPLVSVQRFRLVARLDALPKLRGIGPLVTRFYRRPGPSRLEQIDRHLLAWVPALRPFGGTAVIQVGKPSAAPAP